jgi:replicative DNA helicase
MQGTMSLARVSDLARVATEAEQLLAGCGAPSDEDLLEQRRKLESAYAKLGAPPAEVAMVPPFDDGENLLVALARPRGGIPLDVPGVAAMLLPLHDELVLLGAREGLGKSTVLVQLADGLNDKGHQVLVFSAEQSWKKWEAISLARRTSTNSRRIMTGHWLDARQWGAAGVWDAGAVRDVLTEAHEKWLPTISRLRRYAAKFPTTAVGIVETVEARLRELDDDERLVVMVDALHNLRAPSTDSRRVEIDRVVETLRGMCQRLQVPLIATCHLSREGALKESGGLDYLADVAILLTQDEDKQQEYRGKYGATDLTLERDSYTLRYVEARVRKQRDGETGSALLRFHTAVRRFEEVTP